MKISHQPSPNCGERRGGATPDLIVLHYTAMADCQGAQDWLCNPESEVSAHYLISAQGEVVQMVEEKDRAWHAGAGAWGGCDDVNSRSIGIELANDGFSPFAAAQMDALEYLLAGIMDRWSIQPERIIGHSDMALGRKVDPGSRFDWRRLALNGLSVWPEPGFPIAREAAEFMIRAGDFGYSAEPGASDVLRAFRLRFRPGKTGPLDKTDMALISDLAKSFPVDQTPMNP